MTTIAVTGATGTIGSLTTEHLVSVGHRPRLLAPRPDRLPSDLPSAACSYADADGTRTALEGVDVVLFVSGREDADRLDQHRTFAAAAAAAGIRHVVYTSFVGASADSTFTLGRDHAATEDAIRESGVAWTMLRDNFYSEVFRYFADDDGVIRGPAGDGRVAAVSQRDVAAVAAHVLADPDRHAGATYDLTGPRALDLTEIAAVLSGTTGRPYRYEQETVEEARASRASYGAPDWQVDAWVSTYTAIAAGELAAVSDDVDRLLGRPATPFADAV